MGLISVTNQQPADGDTPIAASDVNNQVNTLVTEFNGNIDTDNLDVSKVFGTLYPVGSIYINATVATNPGTLLGFGTWAAFGTGRVVVGVDSGDSDFNTVIETGGSKTVAHTHTGPSHRHALTTYLSGAAGGAVSVLGGGAVYTGYQGTGNTGSKSPSVVQPYITAYMWKRTA